MNQATAIQITQNWIKEVVIGLQLCPFAKQVFDDDLIRYCVSDAETELDLLVDLEVELKWLSNNQQTRTAFIIHPNILIDFDSYNQFLYKAEELLMVRGLEDEFQIASFHPQYQFANTQVNSAENFTNRSPLPMLHLLRQSDVTQALEFYPDIDNVPQQNIERMQKLGYHNLQKLFEKLCYSNH